MPRPNKPGYFPTRNCWRFTLAGKRRYFCKGVRPDQKPQREGIPRVVWDEMDRLLRDAEDRDSSGVDPTVYWLFTRYIDWIAAEVKADRVGVKLYQNTKCRLIVASDYLPGVQGRARSLSHDELDEFFAKLRATSLGRRGAAPSGHYVHDVGKTIRACFRWAARPVAGRVPARLIHPNPLEGYAWPKQPGAVRGYVEAVVVRRFLRWSWAKARWADNDRKSRRPDEPRPLKPPVDTAESLKRRFDRIFLLMLWFQRLTGCRPEEACRLEWRELANGPEHRPRWEGGVITIDPKRVKTRKQTDRARRIWITPPVARLLRVLERLPGRHPAFVFPHMRAKNASLRGHHDPLAGEPWPSGSAASGKVYDLRQAAIAEGLVGVVDVGPKKLVAYANRHGYASEGSSLGFSDEQMAEQLGNSPEVMRRVYAHSVDEAASQRADEIAQKRRSVVKRPDRA